jgi:hypothetical protein
MKPTDISAPDYFHKVDGFGLGMLFRDHRAATPALSIREPPLQKSKGHSSSVGERVLDRRQCLIGAERALNWEYRLEGSAS